MLGRMKATANRCVSGSWSARGDDVRSGFYLLSRALPPQSPCDRMDGGNGIVTTRGRVREVLTAAGVCASQSQSANLCALCPLIEVAPLMCWRQRFYMSKSTRPHKRQPCRRTLPHVHHVVPKSAAWRPLTEDAAARAGVEACAERLCNASVAPRARRGSEMWLLGSAWMEATQKGEPFEIVPAAARCAGEGGGEDRERSLVRLALAPSHVVPRLVRAIARHVPAEARA